MRTRENRLRQEINSKTKEVKKMKKVLFTMLVIFLAVVMIYGFSAKADAAISGACVNCHTMHNSQNGVAIVAAGAQPTLMKYTGGCIGCHAQNTSANVVSSIPQVLHTNATDLAGGNFRYRTNAATDPNVHNVMGVVSVQDTLLALTPPGFASVYDPASTDYSSTTRMTCAGAQGCHGNRDQATVAAAMAGTHHAADAMLKFPTLNEATQGTSVATSYRFLYRVKGAENTGWLNTSASSHNEYKGQTFATRSTQAWSDIDTMSEFCSECHGNFHLSGGTGIGTGTPWLRHPTDAVMPNTGEYASATTAYSIVTPFARATIPGAPGSTVAAGTGIVMCLTCHSAHGSNFADIMRFDYSTQSAGAGCLKCHTGKAAY